MPDRPKYPSPPDRDWLQQSRSGLVVVVFAASWSGSAQILLVYLRAIAREFPSVKLHQIDIESEPQLKKAYGIRHNPTTIVFRDGEVADVISRPLSRTKLQQRIESLLPN